MRRESHAGGTVKGLRLKVKIGGVFMCLNHVSRLPLYGHEEVWSQSDQWAPEIPSSSEASTHKSSMSGVGGGQPSRVDHVTRNTSGLNWRRGSSAGSYGHNFIQANTEIQESLRRMRIEVWSWWNMNVTLNRVKRLISIKKTTYGRQRLRWEIQALKKKKKDKHKTGTSSSLSECEITHLQYLLCGKKGFKGPFKTVAKTSSTFLMPELNSGGRWPLVDKVGTAGHMDELLLSSWNTF